jgi:hypothetical protein
MATPNDIGSFWFETWVGCEAMPIDTDADNRRCLALLVIDNEPIRDQVELELQTVREAIERCEEEIARHQELDLPGFRQWMAVQCSDLLNERRLIEEKIWSLRARLSAIQGLTQHGIRNVAEAYFWFREIEENRTAIPPYVRRAWQEVTVGRPEKQGARAVESGRFDEGPDDEDDDAFAGWSDEMGDQFPDGSAERANLKPGKERAEVARYKSLYRQIALVLHPDLAGALTKQELELWYQAQRAYEERDTVALETILARCDRVGTKSRTLSELRAFVRQAHSRLATLQQSIVVLAESPSWRFLLLSASEVNVRLRAARRELEGVIRGLLREATMMENELARIETRTDQWMRRRKREEKQLALGF